MSKAYGTAEFSNQITADRNWRLKEISDLKTAAKRAEPRLQKVLLRSLVAICYAHWEGYVRFAAHKYMQHISLRKLPYAELAPQFLKNYFLPRLDSLSKRQTGIKERCALIDEILTAPEYRFARVNEDLISTRSNLNFDVLQDICIVCALEPDSFELKQTFIDVILLKRRNGIAHGEDTFVDVDELDEITTGTVSLMRQFGDLLENAVHSQTYKV